MKKIITLMLFLTFFAHTNNSKPGSQYLKAAEARDQHAQYFLANSWFSSSDLSKAKYWAQKATNSSDADACTLLAQIKITNPVSLDYPQAKVLAEKAAQAGSKEGEVTLAHILVNTQAGKPDYPKAISLLENTSEDLENNSAINAQMLLGLIYTNSMGIKANNDKATWYFKHSSAISQTSYSKYWAGMMFLNSEEGFIKKNKQKALHWLNLSCMEGFDTRCEEFEKLTNS